MSRVYVAPLLFLVVGAIIVNAYGCYNKDKKWRNQSKFSTFYIIISWCEIYFTQSANYTSVFRCDAMVVFDLLTMIADETDVSSDI